MGKKRHWDDQTNTWTDESLPGIAAMIRETMRLLGFSKKDMCAVFRIDRSELKSWLAYRVPELDFYKVDALSSLVNASGIAEPLCKKYTKEPIEGYSSSIFDCLRREGYVKWFVYMNLLKCAGERDDTVSEDVIALPERLRAAERLTVERKRRKAR